MIKKLGVMLDCARNCAYTVDAIKGYIDVLAEMGYNYLQIYTEDAFKVDDEPHFGYLRGAYTIADFKELDGYAASRGMELVPCIQTLAHLMGVTRWWAYEDVRDTSNILLIDEPRTYELIDNMFRTCAEAFTSRRINIGMDEADTVGLGNYLKKHGYKNRSEILVKHLNKVCEIAQKYGFTPMMWSDMFFRLATDGDYTVPDGYKFPKSVIDKVPPCVELAYWNYYSDDESAYDKMFAAHKQFVNNRTVFACGAWVWGGFTPHNNFSTRVNEKAFRACERNGIDEILVTVWKDDYGESSLYSNLTTLYASAEMARGNTDMARIKQSFERKYGIAFDDYNALDIPDLLDGADKSNPSKYMLYSDPFLGFMDWTADPAKTHIFAEAKQKIEKSCGHKTYGYVFQTMAALADVLINKYDLGLRTRAIYRSGDKQKIKALAEEYLLVRKKVKTLYDAFKTQRDKEAKPYGFEHHDVRFGGLMMRLEHLSDRLYAYADGKIDCIPELEEDILPLSDKYEQGKSVNYNHWHATALVKYVEN